MRTQFASFIQWLRTPAGPRHIDLASTLMTSAGARAGLNPRQARELRNAACAYLSVVR